MSMHYTQQIERDKAKIKRVKQILSSRQRFFPLLFCDSLKTSKNVLNLFLFIFLSQK